MKNVGYAPGARVVVRDAEWLVRRIDRTSTGGQALSVVGLSELVKDNEETIFLVGIEGAGSGIEVMDLTEARLVPDVFSSPCNSLLHIESLLRARHQIQPPKPRQASLIPFRHFHHAFGHPTRRQTEVRRLYGKSREPWSVIRVECSPRHAGRKRAAATLSFRDSQGNQVVE